MKILIADDEPGIANGIASILQKRKDLHCQLRIAENGLEALSIAEHFRPDLVITDIRMYQMSGLQLAEELKAKGICNKVIIISGYNQFDYAQRAIRVNVIDYLLKPIDKQQLLHLVERVYNELPESYSSPNSNPALFEHEFFHLDLENENYPSSLKKGIQYMKKNYMLDISLQSLSDELMLHPNYISSLINKYLCVNFSYVLDCIRLKKACELLVSTPEITNAELSYLVGYNNERRLYSAFQKRLSCTPGDFRKLMSGNK